MTREEFYNELERHDWTYSYSDDFRVYQSGEANIKRLKGIAAQSEELTELFDAYSAWYADNGQRVTDAQVNRVRLKPDSELDPEWHFVGQDRIDRNHEMFDIDS